MGLIVLELLCLIAIAFVTTTAWSKGIWAALPFTVLVAIVAVRTLRSISTRIATIRGVANGRFSVIKTLSLTEAFISLGHLSAEAALGKCFEAMDASGGFDNRSMSEGSVRGTIKQSFARKHPVCSVSASTDTLHLRFELEEGGAIWADGGRFEREIHRIRSRLHD